MTSQSYTEFQPSIGSPVTINTAVKWTPFATNEAELRMNEEMALKMV